ncbi:hypothetical protein HAX54_034451, partial [Datura stramonium]|nr:hypothetical protein [Datura stramonium]
GWRIVARNTDEGHGSVGAGGAVRASAPGLRPQPPARLSVLDDAPPPMMMRDGVRAFTLSISSK